MIEWLEKYYFDLINCKYRESCKKAARIKAGDLFYPVPPKVLCINPKIIFLAMEPSGAWAKNDIDARNQINNGLRCYWSHLGDFTVHFSARTILDESFGRNHCYDYYITNMAKCALKVKDAKKSQFKRWKNCQNILKYELEYILKERPHIEFPIFISIGNAPRDWFKNNPLIISTDNGIRNIKIKDKILHYSKSKLHINLDKYLLNDPALNDICESELLSTKEKLYKFVINERKKSPIGAEKALQEVEKDKYLTLYSKLAIVYRETLKKHLNETSKKI